MLRKKQKSIIKIIAVFLILSFAIFPADAHASSNVKKMTVYENVCKVKNTVYCACNAGVYKVNLKTSKVTTLIKNNAYKTGRYYGRIKYYKGYLYYTKSNDDTCLGLYRIKPSTKKIETISKDMEILGYALSGKKVYTCIGDDLLEKEYNRVMSLNGNNKKITKTKPKMTIKISNASGYSIVEKWNESSVTTSKFYLQKPNGKRIYLGKVRVF